LLKESSGTWEKFTDSDFQPRLESLIADQNNTKLSFKKVEKWKKFVWKRASEFMDKGFKIFDEVPSF
jgi:hypothetical protein